MYAMLQFIRRSVFRILPAVLLYTGFPAVFFFVSALFAAFIFFFFFNDTAPTEISPLPLHDALPISRRIARPSSPRVAWCAPSAKSLASANFSAPSASPHYPATRQQEPSHAEHANYNRISPGFRGDRKSTRLNSSH